METARQTSLMENPEIVELFGVLERNGLSKEHKEVESLVKYLDTMEVQFGEVLEELRDVKEQLSQIQDRGMKASVLRITEQAQGKVREVEGQLTRVRKNLIRSAGNALQTYKEKGRDALQKAVSAMKIPSALARIEEGLHTTVESMNRQADKMKVLNRELQVAGGHIKNVGRILRGKEQEKIEIQTTDKGITTKIRKSFLVLSGRLSSMEQTTGQCEETSGTVRAEGRKETICERGTEKIERGKENGSPVAGSRERSGKGVRKGELRNENSEEQRKMVSGRAGGMHPVVWHVLVSSDQPLCGCTESGERIHQTGRDCGAGRGHAGERTGGRGAGSDFSFRAVCRFVFHE